ncbi:MAG: hypothetical protein NVS3B3_23100 [Aquirhabdus sp.]
MTTNTPSKKKLSVAEYISKQIDASSKSQKQIAEEVGFPKPNMMTMIKQGASKVPIGKIAALAEALNVEKLYLYKLVMQEYEPETWESIQKSILKQPVVTANELAIIKTLRSLNYDDVKLIDAEDKKILATAFQQIEKRHADGEQTRLRTQSGS